MKIKFLIFVTMLSLITAQGRLIHKNKTKTSGLIQTENPNPAIRLTRDVEDISLSGFSEDDAASEEFVKSYNRRQKAFLESSPKSVRVARGSSEELHNNRLVLFPEVKPDHSRVLVQKPIPKFNDVDYDDFQTKMNKARSLFIDSGDHEDEDFNLNDYDFDVNHDEYLSGGKPLQPRMNHKATENTFSSKPPQKLRVKIVKHRAIKREGPAEEYSKESIDDSDEGPTTTTVTDSNHGGETESDYSDEANDSVESKKDTTRAVRSEDANKFMTKLGQQAFKVMSKFLSVLPMFPQMPNEKDLNTIS